MKYLMLDTNIYIDMLVARYQAHKPESYRHLMKLLSYGEVRLIVPSIVKTEVFRHLDNEIVKIGNTIKGIKSKINSLYWINHIEEIEQFNQKLKPVKNGINDITHGFEQSQSIYIKNAMDLFDKLFQHEHTLIVDETEELVFKASQRQIHKLRPFHYGKDKDSMADSIIIETLINIQDLISFNNDDQAYFISRNTEDFSEKGDKNQLHKDIELSLKNKKIDDRIHYRILFTKTLLDDFKTESEHAELIEELIAEEEWLKEYVLQDCIDSETDRIREGAGLTSLSADYEGKIAELNEIHDLFNELEEFQGIFLSEYETYSNIYSLLEEELDSRGFDEILELIVHFNQQRPLLEINIEGCNDKHDLINEIFSIIHRLCFNNEEVVIDDMFRYQDYFELNATLATIQDFNGVEYKIDTSGYLIPDHGGRDSIYLSILKEEQKIEVGEITINYGFLEIDDDGNVGDGSAQDIDVHIENVITEIESIKKEIMSEIVFNQKILKRIIEKLGINIELSFLN
ncbi:PIN domain-containing protein [Bacillus mycoides]|uniref:PIN domain-containing protein n=1 Tax=Bacillus mycoides TaxID=1405 RepID=UPI003D653DCF